MIIKTVGELVKFIKDNNLPDTTEISLVTYSEDVESGSVELDTYKNTLQIIGSAEDV